ncbi:MAG: sigma 54-interacting transcriptional regulator [Fuerstiella sp.]|nr:sigma 54-interacting transcriptional regulator [Fuerstiella sp.]
MSSRRRNLLDHLLVDTDSCVCIIDAKRRVRFFSPGMASWTGWPASQIEGLSCDSPDAEKTTAADLLAAAFNPTTASWQGQTQLWRGVLPTASGGVVRSEFCSIPISSASGQIERVVVLRTNRDSGSEHIFEHSPGQQLHAEVAALRADFRNRYGWNSFIGADHSMVRARQLAGLLKNSDCHFTVTGNPGTGRRHLAQCVHTGGPAGDSSFVPVCCSLLSTDAIYNALRQIQSFSAEQTGSHEYPGLLVLVDVERVPREVQQWLLKQRSVFPSVRIAATSSVPLERVVAEGWMLDEFHQLIAPIEIFLPPLHRRGRDVLLLAHAFIQNNRRQHQTVPVELSRKVAEKILEYQWPGNVRELQQVIHDACRSCTGNVIGVEDLSFAFRAGMEAQRVAPDSAKPFQSLDELLRTAERRIMETTLASCGGNKAEAARRLGLTRPSFYRRLKAIGIGQDKNPS